MSKTQSQVTELDDGSAPAAGKSAADSKAAPKELTGKNHDDTLSGARRAITIHPTNEDGGSDAVFVSLNGYAYQIPRGEPFQVPVEVIEIIKNAKFTALTQAPGGGIVERVTQRFPFTLE